MNQTERNKQDRAFLHDMATPITILKHVLKKLDSKSLSPEEIQKACESSIPKALKALAKIEELHANQKLAISERESEETEKAA